VLDGHMCGWFRISGGSVRALAWESFTQEFGNHFLWGHGARPNKKTKTGFMHLLCARMLQPEKKTSANRECMLGVPRECSFLVSNPGIL
jgi:hypothetical protein